MFTKAVCRGVSRRLRTRPTVGNLLEQECVSRILLVCDHLATPAFIELPRWQVVPENPQAACRATVLMELAHQGPHERASCTMTLSGLEHIQAEDLPLQPQTPKLLGALRAARTKTDNVRVGLGDQHRVSIGHAPFVKNPFPHGTTDCDGITRQKTWRQQIAICFLPGCHVHPGEGLRVTGRGTADNPVIRCAHSMLKARRDPAQTKGCANFSVANTRCTDGRSSTRRR